MIDVPYVTAFEDNDRLVCSCPVTSNEHGADEEVEDVACLRARGNDETENSSFFPET